MVTLPLTNLEHRLLCYYTIYRYDLVQHLPLSTLSKSNYINLVQRSPKSERYLLIRLVIHGPTLLYLFISEKRWPTSSSFRVSNTSITTFCFSRSQRPFSASSSSAATRCCPSTMPRVYNWFSFVSCQAGRGCEKSGR